MTKITKHRVENGTTLKHCSRCKVFRPIGGFSKQKAKWDGLRSNCKDCCQKYIKEYRIKNAEKIAAQKAHKWRNDEKYREANKRCNRVKYQTDSAYREKWKKHAYERSQRPEVKERKQITNRERMEKIRRDPEKYRAHRDKNNIWQKKKAKKDPCFRMSCRIRAGLQHSLKKAKLNKNNRTFKYVSCSPSFLLDRLERQRKERGLDEAYHIDHMKPLASFDLSDPEQLRRAWHFSNLQALLAKDNLEKSNKIIYDMRWNEKRDEWWIRNKDNKGPYRPTALFQSILLV